MDQHCRTVSQHLLQPLRYEPGVQVGSRYPADCKLNGRLIASFSRLIETLLIGHNDAISIVCSRQGGSPVGGVDRHVDDAEADLGLGRAAPARRL